jgi:hypothetical protein
MIPWRPIAELPDELKDGRWILLKGGEVDHYWDEESDHPPAVVAQWAEYGECWQFAWYDSGTYGEYSSPTHFAEITPP